MSDAGPPHVAAQQKPQEWLVNPPAEIRPYDQGLLNHMVSFNKRPATRWGLYQLKCGFNPYK